MRVPLLTAETASLSLEAFLPFSFEIYSFFLVKGWTICNLLATVSNVTYNWLVIHIVSLSIPKAASVKKSQKGFLSFAIMKKNCFWFDLENLNISFEMLGALAM